MSFCRKLLIFSGVSLTVGGAGGYAMYQRRLKDNRSVTAEDYNAAQDTAQLEQAYQLLKKKEGGQLATKFFRYTTCPWCGTVKAFLDFNRIPHECVEVEPMFKGELACSEYKKVPQLRFDTPQGPGPFLVDSKLIVDTLADKLGYGKQLKDADVEKWRTWARGPLVRFVTLEFNDSLLAAWKGYSYIDDCSTIPYANKLFLKVIGAPVMYLVAMKVTKPRLIRDGFMKADDVPKKRLHEELGRFVQEALTDPKSKKPRSFHGGSAPDLADLDAFGVLQSVRGHRVYNEIIAESQLSPWMDAMDKVVGNAAYIPKKP